jgi:predicted DNA-binding protein (UPF0251 family)
MTRPKLPRFIKFKPNIYYFKPRGIPLRSLEEITLFPDELEAIKIYNIDGFEQIEAAKMMNISQPTFARILKSAFIKLSQAIIYGKAIRIEKYTK